MQRTGSTRTYPRKYPDTGNMPEKIGILSLSERRATVETRDGEIYYIFGLRTRGYVHGDTIGIRETRKAKDGKLPEAEPVRLIERSKQDLLATITIRRGQKSLTIIRELGGLPIEIADIPAVGGEGDFFVVQFTGRKEGKIIKYFGKKNDPIITEDIIMFRHGIRMTWPETVKREETKDIEIPDFQDAKNNSHERHKIASLFPKVKIGAHERLDFRGWPTITIDGSDAKDLDDAISIMRYDDGSYLLGVHIADVSEYVSEGSALDREAYLRGTSVYTPGRVIPMLPEILSNDRCSLHPGTPKLVLSILMHIDSSGQVKDSYVTEGVIESIHRGVYDEIYEQLIIINEGGRVDSEKAEKQGNGESEGATLFERRGEKENDERQQRKSEFVDPSGAFGTFQSGKVQKKILQGFLSLYQILTKRRKKEGKILFEITECYFEMGEKRIPKDIKKRVRNDAHMLIEEFMIIANEEVAKWCAKHKLPFLSRVHGAPGTEDMEKLAKILKDQSLAAHLEPRHIRDHLEKLTDPRERYRLSRLLLPKMAKAIYGDTPKGHFGLALAYYSHFTSPIRRYPDLLVHRIMKTFLHGELEGEVRAKYARDMKRHGKSLSEKEKQAEGVERAVDALMMCRYMQDKIGYTYRGTISGLTESNVYVELSNGVEGSIFLGRSQSLDTPKNSPLRKGAGGIFSGEKKYILDEIEGALRDTSGKILYRIGDEIDTKILSVDTEERRIELEEVKK